MRRLGADLHDGPAQLISLALLRLDAGCVLVDGREDRPDDGLTAEERRKIHQVLVEALTEIRNMSVGLALPEIEGLTLRQTIEVAISNHEQRTGTEVASELSLPTTSVAQMVKATAYRFVQEGLNNAFNHAAGNGQFVAAIVEAGVATIEVRDDGPGFDTAEAERSERLGIAGLRERLQSLGGNFEIFSSPVGGTRLIARFPFLYFRLNLQ